MATISGSDKINVIRRNFTSEFFNIITTSTSNGTENVVVSPFLLEALLALLYLGADGVTAEQLSDVLQLKQRFSSSANMANYYDANFKIATSGADTKVEMCNKMIFDESCEIGEEFKQIAQKYFKIKTEILNFENIQELRELVCKSIAMTTICESILQQQIEAAAKALLIISANFKSKWFLPFSAYRSGVYDFQMITEPPQVKQVPMLFDDDMFVKYGEFRELDARAIELPYEHDSAELSMLLILPNKRNGIADLTQKLTKLDDLTALVNRMQMESVQVLLPKFKVDFECNLRECLQKLGMTTIFSDDANFKNSLKANSQGSLKYLDILHKVRIEVNESGSEISSIVGNKPIIITNSIDSKKKFFRADHPFYFAITNGNIIYFIGLVKKC